MGYVCVTSSLGFEMREADDATAGLSEDWLPEEVYQGRILCVERHPLWQ
jgi:hypothetical protein